MEKFEQKARSNGWSPEYYRLTSWFAMKNDIESLKAIIGLGYQHDDKTINHAAAAGNIEIVKWLLEIGSPMSSAACWGAAQRGNLDALRWLHENGFPWTDSVHKIAAYHCHLDIMQYAYENGLPIPLNIRKEQCLGNTAEQKKQIWDWLDSLTDEEKQNPRMLPLTKSAI